MSLVAHWTVLGASTRDRSLSAADIAVLHAVLSRMDAQGVAWPSLKRIAIDANVGRSSVVRALQQLCAGGYLIRDSGSRTSSNRYRIGRREPGPRCEIEPRCEVGPGVGANLGLEVGANLVPELVPLNLSIEPDQSLVAQPAKKARRPSLPETVRAITEDAVETFNAVLGQPTGLLPAIRLQVARNKRESQVRRILGTARDICGESYGSPTITREFWIDYWALVDQDDFHSGRKAGGPGHENWRPDFEFLTRPQTLLKIYDRASSAPSE